MRKIQNPHKLFTDDDIVSGDRDELLRLSTLVDTVHSTVWGGGRSDRQEIEAEFEELLEAANSDESVYVGISFLETPDGGIGKVLSYILAYEIPSTVESMRSDPDTMESLEAVALTPEAAAKILNGRRVLYVANYTRLPTEEAKRENAGLFKSVLAFAMEQNFVVTARCRVSTSYKVLKRFADKGYINFLFDLPSDSSEYRTVVIEINQSNRVVRFFRKYLLWANVAKEIGKGFIARAVRGGLKRLRRGQRRIGR